MALRYKIYPILEDDTETIVYNPTTVDWNSFPWTNGFFLHFVSKKEILQPDLISYAYYGTTDYWDIILLLNNIVDMEEVPIGSEFKIPKLEDLKKFIAEVRK